MSNKVSDQLFRLVKSMSKAEKRYFKLFANRHSSEANNYIKLFDAIDKQEEYDEDEILEKFSKESVVNNFSIAKGRLYDTILRSLDAFHAESSPESLLEREIHYVEILFKKALYDQSRKLLSSIKKTALKNEYFTILLKVVDWEKKLIEKDNYADFSNDDIDNILGQDLSYAKVMDNLNLFWNIKSKFFMHLNRVGKVRSDEELKRFKTILDHPILKKEENALSIKSKYLYHHIYSAYYFGVDDYKNSYKHLISNIKLVEANVNVFYDEPNIYFSILTNAIYIGSQLKKYKEVFGNLKKLKNVSQVFPSKNNEDVDVKLFSSANSIELNLYNHLGEFDKALGLIPRIETGIRKYSTKLSKVRKADFYFNIAITFFASEDYASALKWINKLLNDKTISQSEDIYCFAQFLNLLIHVELEHDDLVPYAFKSTHRFLIKRNRVYKFENIFLDFISRILKAESEKELNKYYKLLYEELSGIENDSFEKNVFEYFDFISWAKAKYTGTSFWKVVKQKNKEISIEI